VSNSGPSRQNQSPRSPTHGRANAEEPQSFARWAPCGVTVIMFVDLSDTQLLAMLGAELPGLASRQARGGVRTLHLVLYTSAQPVPIWPVSGEVRSAVC
jgi:hypothetical protein